MSANSTVEVLPPLLHDSIESLVEESAIISSEGNEDSLNSSGIRTHSTSVGTGCDTSNDGSSSNILSETAFKDAVAGQSSLYNIGNFCELKVPARYTSSLFQFSFMKV